MTKQALDNRLREIRDSHPDEGDEVTGDEKEFVVAVLAHHPGGTEWQPLGNIVRITCSWNYPEPGSVAPGAHWKTRGFHVHYRRGAEWAFSWKRCLRNMSKCDVEVLCSTHWEAVA